MKIFFDCTYLRSTRTGVDIYFLNLIHHLLKSDQENKYTILIDTRYNDHYLLNEMKKFSNYKILKIYSPLPLQVLYSAFFLPFYLRFKKYDVYHNPYFFGPLLNFICSSTKIVITVHDLYHRSVPQMMNKALNRIFRIFADNAIKRADEVIVISNQTKSDVVKYLKIPTHRLNLIYQALDSKFEGTHPNNNNIEKFGLTPNKYILSVGKVLPSKGFNELIEAFEVLVTRYSFQNIYLVIAGMHPGDYIFQIKKQIEQLNIDQGLIKLLGYVDDEDLLSLYANANMVVSPSYYEGFGLPVLEAMQYGRPVIARFASSLIEVVDDAGLFFSTPDELANQMNKLLIDHELRNAMIKRGYQRLKAFSWIETANKTLEVYSKM